MTVPARGGMVEVESVLLEGAKPELALPMLRGISLLVSTVVQLAERIYGLCR